MLEIVGAAIIGAGVAAGVAFLVWGRKCKAEMARNKALMSVIDASQSLGSSTSLESVMSVISKCIKALFSIDTMAVYLVDEENLDEASMLVKGVESIHGGVFIDFNPDKVRSAIGKVLHSRTPMRFDDFSAEAKDESLVPLDKGFRSVMIAPLIFEGRSIGVIFVAHSKPGLYTAETLHSFELLCSQVALAVRNAQLQEGLSALAIRDSLSGLFNHGYFQEHLGKAIIKAKYAKQPVSLLILDVDYFKKVNDNYGHPQGDALLKQLGGVIRSVVRPSDVICRYGGDEFTVTMIDTSQIQASVLAEKIRQTVEEYEFVIGSQIVHITVSGGVSSFPEGCSSKKDLITKADEAMYKAKKSGRNKIKF